ncbi:TonB-dependent receptor domain-containing protein [Sphingomonas sp.]|uniref:TonB-dependent receptor domain-containing protein n=1 Tax=Sphingomonas sp. TaxID=28214 RepID=UPI003F7F46A2
MPAFAQTAPAPDDQSIASAPADDSNPNDKEIIITGSRIARSGKYDTVEPVLTLDSKQIEARGFTTLGQALNELPAFGVPDSSPIGGQSSFGPGQSFVNFFGLGSQRTLTLVNGRRFVGSNTSSIFGPTGNGGDQVDLNVIPTKLIDRVETVAVGGAPIYGSDAIAGTINVILKKDYQGFELDGQYEIAEKGDAPNYRIRALAGHNFAGGRGNITIAGEYNEGKGLLYTDRELPGLGRYYDTPTTAGTGFLRQFYPDRRIPITDAAGIPLVSSYIGYILGSNIVLPPKYQQAYSVYSKYLTGGPIVPLNGGVTNGVSPTSVMKFDSAGNLIPIDFGLTTSLVNASGGNGYSLTDLSNLLTNTKRYNGIATASYQITDHVRVFGEAWYSHSEGTNLRDQPEYNGGLFGAPGDPSGQVILSINNPFLSPAARAQIQNSINNNLLSDQNVLGITQDYFLLDRANTDLVSGRVRGQVDIMRFVGGFDGDFQVGGNTWKWEISGNYGKSITKSAIPVINTQNFDNAVGAITASNPNGIPCLAGLTSSPGPTISSTCSPLNLFGIGVSSQAARDYVTMIATPKSTNTQKDFTASLTGPLFKLPGGNLSFAIGVEHREEHENFDPSAAYLGAPDSNPAVDSNGDGDPTNDRTSYGQVVPIVPINAGYHTNEVYGEIQAQLIGPDNNIPGFNSLEFQGALRYVDNSVNGGAFTWTAGGKWAPIKDLTIRGNFTRSIRSPSITENQNPAQTYFDFATDPCDVTELGNGPAPATRKANCAAALNALGVDPTTFSALSDDRSFTQAVRGDASLKNEAANSWTVGAIVQPRFIRGLTFSADYVDITVKNVISSLGSNQVLSDCYDSTTYPSNPFCSRILRDSSGQLSYIVTGYANQDQLKFRGIVAQGDFRTRTPFLGKDSSIGIGVSYQHLFELSTTTEGTKTNTAGNVGYAKDKGVLSLTYDNGPFEYYAQLAYIGPSFQNINLAPNFEPFNHENAVVFTNMAISFTVQKNFQFRLGVDNVFNTKPPYPSSGTNDVYFRGTLGRYFRFGAGIKF